MLVSLSQLKQRKQGGWRDQLLNSFGSQICNPINKTGLRLRQRFNQHRNGIRNAKGALGQHFENFGCNPNDYTVQIIDVIEDETRRKMKEYFWIKKLRTIQPHGMNSDLRPLCNYYLHGNCRWGRSCYYRHG